MEDQQKARAIQNGVKIFEVMEAMLLAARMDPATAPLFKDEAWLELFNQAERWRQVVRKGGGK